LRWFGFALSSEAVSAYGRALSIDRTERALESLARAISGSEGLAGGIGACAVASPRERRLAVLADAGSETAVEAQVGGVESICRQLRFVDYLEADQVAAALARQLHRRFGDELRTWPRAAIPRGGWLVAGLLARHLPRAIAEGDVDQPLLVMDDCALTGAVLRRFLGGVGARRVVFAPLFASAALARAVERAEDRVEAVIMGEELAERGKDQLGDGYSSWRQRWRSRLGAEPYWLGISDFICFPWNEPRRWVWNPHSETMECGWRLLPPERTARRRAASEPQPESGRKGPIRPAAGVVWAEAEGRVYVGRVPTGESFQLAGVAASLWRTLVRGGDRKTMLDAVTSGFEVDDETAARDIDRWLHEIEDQGLIETDAV
jgi:hypothetical protein